MNVMHHQTPERDSIMNVVQLRTAASAPVHFIGRLSGMLSDGRLGVEDEEGIVWPCRRAASCLLRPEEGDLVMVSGPDLPRAYLIAVVEQADTGSSRIDAAGDVTLAARGAGMVSIESEQDVRLRSGANLEMSGGARWVLRAPQAQCDVGELRLTARDVDATAGRMRLVGKVFETVSDRVVQMARHALRMVDGVDQVRVGHLDCKATETVRIHGKHAVMTGKDLVKIDAAQIHMG